MKMQAKATAAAKERAAVEARNSTAAATEENQLQSSSGGSRLVDVTNVGQSVVAAVPTGTAARCSG
jgi:hypothetical protein